MGVGNICDRVVVFCIHIGCSLLGPTITIVVVPFDMVGALRFVVVLPVAVVVLVVITVSGPRAIV